jgi:hypothetical protein
MKFEWDAKKEKANAAKHGVDFSEACEAFLDSNRVLATDEAHSEKEPRFFCIGKTARGILTVRFTTRGDAIRIIGAGYWRKGEKFYEKNQS